MELYTNNESIRSMMQTQCADVQEAFNAYFEDNDCETVSDFLSFAKEAYRNGYHLDRERQFAW
jgi:hypothetical protein